MAYGKIIGGALGWAFGGPIGAVLGIAIGSMIDGVKVESFEYGQTGTGRSGTGGPSTQAGDFILSLLVLSAEVMKADGKMLKSELEYIKQYLVVQFGEDQAGQALKILQKVLKQDYSLRQICLQIRGNMPHPMRLQLLHYLYGIADADGHVHPKEIDVLKHIASYLGINQQDFESIANMVHPSRGSDYKILEIEKNSTNEEVKTAYRKMARKFHPDKVASLGPAYEKAAKEKFQKIQEAYENIKKERGMN